MTDLDLGRTLGGHTHWVRSVCVSADGSRLFSGSYNNTIKVWNRPQVPTILPVPSSSSSSSSSLSLSSAALLSTAFSSELPDELRCPIGHELFKNPVIAGDGFNYEHAQIKKWFQNHNTSPMTNAVLPNKNVIPNHKLRTRCLEWQKLHSTEAGFKKQLKAITADIIMAESPGEALTAVQKIGALLELARSQNFLILGPAGVVTLLELAQVAQMVDEQVASAFAVLKSQSAVHVGEFQEKYRQLQHKRSANAAAAQSFGGSDEEIQRDLAKAKQNEALAKRKDAAAKAALAAAAVKSAKTAAALKSAQEETRRLQKNLENNAKELESFRRLEEDLAAQSAALSEKLKAIGEQVDHEAQETDAGGSSSSSSSSSSSISNQQQTTANSSK